MPEPTASMLSEVIRFVRMTGILYCPSELTEPWGLALPPMDECLWFHVVTSGSCTIEVEPAPPLTVRAGDLVLVPHGLGHRAWGAEPAPTPSVLDLPHENASENYAVLRHGGGGVRTEVVCGGVRLDHPAARHLIDALPPIIHIESSLMPRSEWLHSMLGLMSDETRDPQPGSDVVVSRLCDILVIQAIRIWIEQDPAAKTGWLGALHDPRIGAAMARIHADPGKPWSVASLAAGVAMSRSAFAARFRELVGEPVMQYVTWWRMHSAVDLLETGGTTVATVGRLVGYESEAAFSRAFSRVIGAPPRTARQRPVPSVAEAARTGQQPEVTIMT